MKEFVHLSEKLSDPEYLHLLLEPVMIYGLALGVIVFLFSFFFSERKMQFVALGIIIVSSLAVLPYMEQRKAADDRVVKMRSDLGDVEEMMKDSQDRRRDSRKAYMVVAALAGLTLLMGAHKGKPGMFAGIATSIAGAAVVVHGAWLHLEDAEIYHPNIRVTESADGEGREEKERRREDRREEQARIDDSRGSTQPVSTTPSFGDRRVSTSRPR